MINGLLLYLRFCFILRKNNKFRLVKNMKISLAWVLDHLEHNITDLKSFAADLQDRFNKSVGELESFYYTELKNDMVRGSLGSTKDAWLVKDKSGLRLATYQDLDGSKDGFLPAPYGEEKLFKAGDFADVILEIDNKSLTHRADLWCHYGIAREVGALYGFKLKPLSELPVNISDNAQTGSVKVKIDSSIKNACKSFSAVQIDNVQITPSPFWMVLRLARVGSRSINLPVDLTNYTMLDVGNPLHAFDLKALSSGVIEPKFASNKEKLALLDGKEIELCDQDLIITNGSKPLALAGIMGGLDSGVNDSTKNLLVEAVVFDPGVIRKAALRHKTRTEASSRFEKGLDCSGNILALKQFITKLKEFQPNIMVSSLASLGDKPIEQKIDINLDRFKKILSMDISDQQIIDILKSLHFKVAQKDNSLEVVVPSFRGSREFIHEADVLEEVGRVIGFEKVISSIPKLPLKGWNLERHLKLRSIKDFCAYAGSMQEVSNYPLYDQLWLQELKLDLDTNFKVINPVSEFRFQPVSTLLIHLAQNIFNNLQRDIKVFEVGSVWSLDKNKPIETKKLAVSWLGSEAFFDFKAFFINLFASLGLNVSWSKGENYFFKKDATAQLKLGDKIIGFVGYAAPFIELKVGKPVLIAELDVEPLVNFVPYTQVSPLPKFPVSKLDVSLFVVDKNVAELETVIKNSYNLITGVELIDTMHKPEWGEKKSYTFRYYVTSPDQTLTKEEIGSVQSTVEDNLRSLGATIR